MSDTFDKVLDLFEPPTPASEQERVIGNLRAANDEMRRSLDDKDFALAAANKEIHRLCDGLKEMRAMLFKEEQGK